MRPGEKIHEIMVSSDELSTISKDGKYFLIKHMLSWSKNYKNHTIHESLKGTLIEKMKEYSSRDYVLCKEKLKQIISEHIAFSV